MKRCLLTFLIFAVLNGYAEESIKFKHLSRIDGLSDNQINHITRDSQGFMWFSTSHGLNRYDGYTFKSFSRGIGSMGGMNSVFIEKVQEDASGMLWIKHWEGNYECYDPRKEIFLTADELISENYGISDKISLVYVDRQKNLWLHSHDKGTYYYNFQNRALRLTPSDKNLVKDDAAISSMTDDRTGIVRIYTNGFFDRINKNSLDIDLRNRQLAQTWGEGTYNIFADSDGDYWVWKHNDGIYVYYPHEKQWERINSADTSRYRLIDNDVRDIINDRYGRVWIAVDNGGINIIDKRHGTIKIIEHDETNDQSLIQNSVISLYADRDGSIWAGTFKRGVSFYNENMFRFSTDHFPEFNNIKNFIPDISAITEDSEQNLYAGVQNGVVKIDHATGNKELKSIPKQLLRIPYDVVLCMQHTENGKLWIGTYQSGLLSLDKDGFKYHCLDPTDSNSPANKSIWAVTLDRNGYLWIGTWGMGLWGLDPVTGRATRYVDPASRFRTENISSILTSKDGKLYMATTYGMLVYNPLTEEFTKQIGTRDGSVQFTSQQLNHITEDSRGLLWISCKEGVDIYDRRNDELTELSAELRNTNIHGITEDNNKDIWITTNDGLYHVIVSGQERNYSYDVRKYNDFSIADNQQTNLRAIMTTLSGKITIGGIRGISIVDPDALQYDSSIPEIRFTDLALFNKSVKIDTLYQGNKILTQAINYTDRINLDYGQNVFSVSFSTMDYTNSGKPGFMYKLDGFDSDWTYTTDNKLTYTNLSPGTYTLMIKAVDADGFTGDKTAALEIEIAPPFYRSWIAYVLYALLFLGCILLVRIYLKHNEAQKYKLMQIEQDARRKHEIDNMKMRFFTNISHDLRTPLTLILTPLEYVLERIEDAEAKGKLNIAHKNALRLLDMVNQLLDFRKSDISGHTLTATGGDIVDTIRTLCNNFMGYSEQRNINLTFFSPMRQLYMTFDEDKINKIMMNLLSNAFKFTPEGGRVDVSLDLAESESGSGEILEIKVADNGCGISDEHKGLIFERFYQVPDRKNKTINGSGIGLNLVKEFVTLHDGTIEVADNVGKGTVFIIKLPVTRLEADTPTDAPDSGAPMQKPTEATEDARVKSGEGITVEEAPNRPAILIVDDNDDFRTFMKDCLKADYTIHEAANGAEAWKMIPELQPDIIVSDVMMPELDGNELCRFVKNDIRTSHILVILLTARAAKEHEQKGLEVGADDYITKPFNLNILSLRIKNLLQRRKDSHKQPMDVSPSKINITSLDEKLIRRAIDYVENNLSRSDLSVEELSSELGMSRVHLYKKMLSITGKTPIEFIRVLRLKRAAQLLRDSQMNVAEVTYQTGFNTLNLFRKYFKAEFGMLPSEYQAKHSTPYQNNI